MRILLDTNLWVAALISHSMRKRIERIIAEARFQILADDELLTELEQVCNRPKFSKIITSIQIESFLAILRDRLTFVDTHSKVQICRDPEDDYLLVICLDGNADYLVTGDHDLLTLKLFGQTRIVTLSDFELVAFS